MSGRLVLTVGGSPLPLLASLLVLQPDHVVALATDRSVDVLPRVLQAAADRGCSPTTELRVVPPFDLEQLDAVSREVLGAAPADIAYASGTPAMSAALVRAHRHHGTGTAWYVAEEGEALLSDDGSHLDARPAFRAAPLTLDDLLTLHDARPEGGRATLPVPPEADLDEAFRALGALPQQVTGADAAQASADLVALVLDALAGILGYEGHVYPASRVVVRGRAGVQVLTLPPCVVSGLRLTVLSIEPYSRHHGGFARGSRLSDLKESLYASAFLARRAGGLHARAVCLGTEPDGDAAGRLRQDLGPITEPDNVLLPDAPPGGLAAFTFAELRLAVAEGAHGSGSDRLTTWLRGVR